MSRAPEQRRWPLAFLEVKAGRRWVHVYARRGGIKVASVKRLVCRVHSEWGGLLTTKEADEMAMAAGFHPVMVWPDWIEGPFLGCADDLFDYLADVS